MYFSVEFSWISASAVAYTVDSPAKALLHVLTHWLLVKQMCSAWASQMLLSFLLNY
jgi:hypothetical protein